MFQLEDLYRIAGKENVQCDELLSKHTTFHIGGAAKYFVSPVYIEDFIQTVCYLRKERMPYFILGNGSNLLAYDRGYEGVIVATHFPGRSVKGVKFSKAHERTMCKENYSHTYEERKDSVLPLSRQACQCEGKTALNACIELKAESEEREKYLKLFSIQEDISEKEMIFAGSGIMLSTFANIIGKKGLAGFEFASGIPGTLGGAVTMNAGAYGGEIKDVILGAQVLLQDGTTAFYSRDELGLGYRTSRIQKDNLIVLGAVFAFERGDIVEIEKKMRELNQKRQEKQPLQYASAGSTFKRPKGFYAGKLIEDAGLRGYRVGDVMVSDKHCGFVVNVGEGTYDDARQVIEHVQKVVKEKFNVWLDLEVKMIE